MCYNVKCDSSVSKGVCIKRSEPLNWGALGPRPLAVGLTPYKYAPLPHVLNLVILGETVALLRRSSYRFRDRRRFQSKIAKFSHPRVFNALAEELGTGAWGQKLERWSYRVEKNNLAISLAIWVQYTNVTDRGKHQQQIPRLRIA